MHLFDMATLFVVLILVGVKFSVSAFVNPAAWRLEPEAQLKMLSCFAPRAWEGDAGLVPGLYPAFRD